MGRFLGDIAPAHEIKYGCVRTWMQTPSEYSTKLVGSDGRSILDTKEICAIRAIFMIAKG